MRTFLLLLSALVALVFGGVYWALHASLPADDGRIELPGLGASASVAYDDHYRPYVQAETLADALSIEGWLHASHRLWQMELFRRAGSGRMAEMLGEDLIDTDSQLWRFGVPQLAKRLAENAGPDMRALVDAYVRGVNAGIAEYPVLPPEFLLLRHEVKPWTHEDVFAVGALMAFQSSNNASKEILRAALHGTLGDERFALFLEDGSDRPGFPFVVALDGDDDADKPDIPSHERWLSALDALDAVDPSQQPLMPRLAFGSNGWVVGPARSATGKALFAFDSHDSLGLPNLFYEVHLFYGDGRQIRGWSAPGLPGVINGFNESIAWGFTNIGDSQDLFLETPIPDRPGYYMEDGRPRKARLETVSIPVRDQAPVRLEIQHTRNGPLISENPPLALRWTVQEIGDLGLDALLAFNQATDWESFNAALDRHAAPVLNATYADTSGTIGFRTAGLLPQRARGEGLMPLAAAAENQWQGLVPAADMPRVSNPPTGFLAAANARVNPADSYPLVSADNAAPYRIARIQSVLGREGLITVADMQALQFDWYDGQAAQVLPTMLAAIVERDDLAEARGLLARWLENPVASPDSAAALIFQSWYLELADALFRPVLGEQLYRRLLGHSYMVNFAVDTLLLTDQHQSWWPAPKSTVLATSLAVTMARLETALGPMSSWRLDARQQVGLRHELSKAVPELAPLFAVEASPWGGTPAAVGRANYSYRKAFDVVHGATVRTVGEMRETPVFQAVIPGGQSGHPRSPHYADQFDAWRRGELFNIEATPPAASLQFEAAPAP